MCTYEVCGEGDQQYDDFKDWVHHEVNVHRHGIMRPVSPSQKPAEECHSTLGVSNGAFQPQSSVAPSDISRHECPICLEKNPTFYHIGLHLRRFAVFALPNSVGTDEDATWADHGSNIANADEDHSISSQCISTTVDMDSMHENDEGGDFHERNRGTHKPQEAVNLPKHASLQINRVFEKGDIGIPVAGHGYGSSSAYSGSSAYSRGPINAASSSQNISFYVMIDSLEPNYQAQRAQHGQHGYWVPPTIRTGYTTRSSNLFYWRGGTMTHIAADEVVSHPLGQIHSAATVFTQNPDTPHLLVIPFDARRRDVDEYPGSWRPLTFGHVRIVGTEDTYSAVSANADRQYIAVRGSSRWMPQLLPRVYDDQSRSTRTQAGLIGSIPLLIALAAFSAPASFLQAVLTNCLRPQRWLPHQYQYPAGRKLQKSVAIPI